jgi:hypothetical protein
MSPSTRLSAVVSLIAGCAVFVVACNATSDVGAFGGGYEDAGLMPYSPDASDAGAPETSVMDVQTAVTPVVMGNPLCQYSTSGSLCSPDSFSVCAPTGSGAPADAGLADAYGGYAAVFGCHVAPAMVAVPDATSAALLTTPAVAPACLPAGLGVDGVPCDSPSDCAPGYECVGTNHGACRHYCCGSSTPACLLSDFCDVQQTVQAPMLTVPVCMPIQPCQLLPNSCPSNETCAVVREDGTKSCVAVGNATAGQSCDTQHCASGLVCLGTTGARTCYTLCAMKANSCTAPQTCKGGPPLFVDPGVGICE